MQKSVFTINLIEGEIINYCTEYARIFFEIQTNKHLHIENKGVL